MLNARVRAEARCVDLWWHLPTQSPKGGEEMPQEKDWAWSGPSSVTELASWAAKLEHGLSPAAEKSAGTSTALSLSHLLMSTASLLLAAANLGRGRMNKSK